MSSERLFLVDPYNESHISLMKEFEKRNSINHSTADILESVAKSVPQEEFSKRKKSSNDVSETLFIEKDSYIKDSCNIQGEKDRKTCTITYAPIKAKLRNRKLINIATNYALNELGMQVIITMFPLDNSGMSEMLEQQGYESLGEDNGSIIYIKEKEELTYQRSR